MKKVIVLLGVACAFFVQAEVTFDLYNDTNLYSYLDDQPGPLSYTNNGIVATFTGIGGVMNRTTSGFGIDAPGSGDTTYLLDFGEALEIYFDQNIQITGLDFRNFSDGESIQILIGSTTNTIGYNDLDHKTSAYIENLTWDVQAFETVRFAVVGETDAIAIDSVTVIPEPATLSMVGLTGLLLLVVRRMVYR
jgi:hypothetical protein